MQQQLQPQMAKGRASDADVAAASEALLVDCGFVHIEYIAGTWIETVWDR